MGVLLVASVGLLWVLLLLTAFLLLGVLRSLATLGLRVEQLEAASAAAGGEEGPDVGSEAPGFALEDTAGRTVALRDLAGRKALVVFTSPACPPCRSLVPDLNVVHDRAELPVVAVSAGDPHSNREWAVAVGARFPVLNGDHTAHHYRAYGTPYAVVVDERGVVAAKGVINNIDHIDELLAVSAG